MGGHEMIELTDRELSLIDSYAVHILSGLINSPNFDPSEYKSTSEMMDQQCDLAYVYGERLLQAKNRYSARKRPVKNSADSIKNNSDNEIIRRFIREKLEESQESMPIRTNKFNEKGLYEFFIEYVQEIGFGNRPKIHELTFSNIFYSEARELGLDVKKKRTNKGMQLYLAIK